MKLTNLTFTTLCLLLLFACESEKQTTESTQIELEEVPEVVEQSVPSAAEQTSPKEVDIPALLEKLTGYYVGGFIAEGMKRGGTHNNKITLAIESITETEIRGRSIVAGNDRPFAGEVDLNAMKVVAKEPGDDRYDGVFEFALTENTDKIKGDWYANDTSLRVSHRTYTLEKRDFAYDQTLDLPDISWEILYNGSEYEEDGEGEFLTEAVTKVNPSRELLTKEEIENMYKGDLEVIRNSIYARHGYSFKNRKMRYVFDRIDWYMPVSTDIRNDLTTLEKTNIDLLKRYEQHAAAYYDSFGR